MIERNLEDFTELDNDYITAYSKILLTPNEEFTNDNYKKIFKNIESLAELGNVNAICAYYWNLNKNNPIVRENLDNLYFEDDHILSMYYNFAMANIHNTFNKRENWTFKDIMKDQKFLKKAFVEGMEEFKKDTKNMLLAEKLFDIKWIDWALSEEFGVKKIFENFSWGELGKIRENLEKSMKENPDDPRYAFYYARCINLYLFGQQIDLLPEGSIDMRTKILENLADRPYSAEMNEKLRFKGFDEKFNRKIAVPINENDGMDMKELNSTIDKVLEHEGKI